MKRTLVEEGLDKETHRHYKVFYNEDIQAYEAYVGRPNCGPILFTNYVPDSQDEEQGVALGMAIDSREFIESGTTEEDLRMR